MAENPLTKLPLAGQLGVAAVLAAIIGGLFWWQYWSPSVLDEAKKTKQLEELRKEIQKLEVTASKLPEFQREVAELESKLGQLRQILPSSKETPELIRRVQALASEARLEILQFRPGKSVRREFAVKQKASTTRLTPAQRRAAASAGPAAPVQEPDYYEEWPININVDGTYHNLGEFFDAVGRLRRLVNIGSLSVTANARQTSSSTIKVSCVATTYVYVEAAKAAGAAGQ